jgi:hypothetical protein
VRRYTTVVSTLMMLVGVAVVVRALLDDSASPGLRIVLGIFFIAAGAGRLYLQRRTT